MIISASRRTDIPNHYSAWFLNRLREGFVLTRNPFNHAQISKVPLNREVVDCIVFWTKDPKNMMPYLKEIDEKGYKYYFQFTLTPYGKDIERNLREKSELISTFIELSKLIGREKVIWRYDPIILTEDINIDYHKEQFLSMVEKLSPYTKTVVISFVDMYKKIKSKMIRGITMEEIQAIAEYIGKTAKKHGLIPRACCEEVDLTPYGIERSSCIDKDLVELIGGERLNIKNDNNQRKFCRCVDSIDIGAYNTCINGCVYCYASYNGQSTIDRYKGHDPYSELLTGNVSGDEKITVRNVKSNIKLKSL